MHVHVSYLIERKEERMVVEYVTEKAYSLSSLTGDLSICVCNLLQ